jgi:hypothetical protein
METTFARWLREHDETRFAFEIKHGLNHGSVARLAGVGRAPSVVNRFSLDFLVKVSQETGIPVGTLIEEARKAAANPIPPRRYTFRSAGP